LGELGHEVHLFALPGSKVPTGGFLHYQPSCELEFFHLYEQSPIKFNKNMLNEADMVWHDFTHSHIIHDYLHWHQKQNVISTPWGSWIQRPFYRQHLVTWSQFQRMLAIQQGYPESTRYVWGGTNTETFQPDLDKPYEKDGYFLFLARMHPDKRPDLFLRLAEAFPNDKFILSGSFGKQATPDHEYFGRMYGEMAKKLKNVTVIPDPSVKEKIRLLQRARALIHPSVRECFGLSIVEALACGTPAIVSDDGAFPEIIQKGKTGWLCRTLEEYVNAIKGVDAFNPEECRRDAVTRWSRERVAKDYLEIYENVARGEAF
jgi:glycosyltransferase involved in cell wall biosynthesis